jgi:ABC-type transport system involved in multi-copper enzyme maturation permease subunit
VRRHPRTPRWGGAIAGWELTRLARRGSPTVARVLVGLLLFAALGVTYLATFPQNLDFRTPPSDVQKGLSHFGQSFALTFLLVQSAVVLILTPLFVAGAIVEETERRTLEFLMATDLSAREIVLGKLWPRLLLLVAIVLAGWPILAATQIWGGVDVVYVGLASVVIVAEAWAVAGISAACAVGATSLRRAMVRSYVLSVLVLTLPVASCPFLIIVALRDVPTWLSSRRGATTFADLYLALAIALFCLHLFTQFMIGFLGIRRACYKLRHARYFYARMPWQTRPSKLQHWEKHPPVPDGSPLLWKEIHLRGQTARFVRMLSLVPWVVWLCVSSVCMVFGLALVLTATHSSEVYESMNGMVRWIGGTFIGLMGLVVGLHAAGTVARERQQETLGNLLAAPQSRRDILRAKWLGSMAKARGIAIGAIAVPLVGVLAEGISYWAAILLVVAAFAFIACAASFGLWLSVHTRTVQRASALWMLLVGVWIGGTLLAAKAAYLDERANQRPTSRGSPTPIEPIVWDRALNPALAWSQLTFRFPYEHEGLSRYERLQAGDGRIESLEEVYPSVLAVGLYCFLAWAFYWLAWRRFEREGQG